MRATLVALAVSLPLLLPRAAAADTLVVDPNDPSAYATIGAAVADASDGDLLEVHPGAYAESVDLDGKDLEIEGVAGPISTWIYPPAGSPGFLVDGSSAVTIRAVSVQVAQAAAVAATSVGTLIVEQLNADAFGQTDPRGIDADDVTDLQLIDVTLLAFSAADAPLARIVDSQFAIVGGTFEFNTSTGGAPMEIVDSDGTIDGGDYRFNEGVDGGAIAIRGTSAVGVTNARFYNNEASGNGGALFVDGAPVDVGWSTFVNNVGVQGGAVAFDTAPAGAELHHSRLLSNVANVEGGGVFAEAGALTIRWCLFADNEATFLEGGGLRLDGVTADVVHVTFAGNAAPEAGGISSAGGAVALTNLIVADSTSGEGIKGDGAVAVTYCDVVDNAGGEYAGAVGDPTGSDGNISDPPLFVDTTPADPADWDLHLDVGSPCIDAGDPALTDPDGSAADMGAYGGPQPLFTDEDQDGVSIEDGDCDDTEAAAFPGNAEVCDGIDNDCSGYADDPFDVDLDGVSTCGPDGIVGNGDDDCDDADAARFPGNTEACDGIDNDCDEQLMAGEDTDADGDGAPSCDDCDDTDPSRFPGNAEVCDGIPDNDCDGVEDSEDLDDDGDGASECEGDCDDTDADLNISDQDNDGYTTCEGDCHDGIASQNPGEEEECDGIDNDCDGELADDETDDDVDGFMICEGDCDDGDPTVYLGASELCDGKDNDCDDYLSAEETDDDGDGFSECLDGDCDDGDSSIFPGATELCNEIDDDCNGIIDEDPGCYEPVYGMTGGGGCNCRQAGDGGRATGAGWLAALGLGLWLGLRRRRGGATARIALPFLAAALAIAPAQAQELKPEVELHTLRANADGLGLFGVEGAEVLGLWQPSFGVHVSYAKDPLLLHIDENVVYPQDKYTYSLVQTMLTLDLQGAIGFGPADVAVALPVHVARLGEGVFDWQELTGGGIGDLRVAPKVTIFNPGRRKYGLAVVLPLTFPLSHATSGVGDPSVRIEPTVVGELRIGPLQTMVNLGPRLRTAPMEMNAVDLSVQHEFVIRYGLGLSPIPQLQVVGEIGASSGGSGEGIDPAEWFAGARVFPGKGLRIDVGAGRGLNDGYGMPDLRVMAGVTYAREREYEAAPRLDADGDGVADAQDGCRKDPEDLDGFEDDDGCPERDNDRDGIADVDDKCPNEAENFNANEDDDGCPDDDPDRDGDGLSDLLDPCPGDAETLNALDDHDGCPDETLASVTGRWTRISVAKPVKFRKGKTDIDPDSEPVLAAVAQILAGYPQITSLEVQAHTDDVGSDKTNLDVSQQRADAIVARLVALGIDAARLVGKGYGESSPILPGTSAEARAINKRVEFHVAALSETPQPVIGEAAAAPEDAAPTEDDTIQLLSDEERKEHDKQVRRAEKKRKKQQTDDEVQAQWETGEPGKVDGEDEEDGGDEADDGGEGGKPVPPADEQPPADEAPPADGGGDSPWG